MSLHIHRIIVVHEVMISCSAVAALPTYLSENFQVAQLAERSCIKPNDTGRTLPWTRRSFCWLNALLAI